MKIKKLLSLIFLFVYIVVFFQVPVRSLEESELTAPSVVLMEPDTGKVLYEKNSHETRVCASITKIMTTLLVMEAVDAGKISISDIVSVSEHAASMGGSNIWLKPGESMSVDELMKATIVASANDAAVVLAEHVAGSELAFVDQMNERAKNLGMKDTVFKNCNGLDEEGHVTSAYDVALMSRELMKHEQIYKYTSIWIDYLRDGKTQLVNTNKLLKSYKGITGLKTGTTSQAGCCISATAERDGLNLNAVVLGCKTGKERFKDAATVLDYGFANYTTVTPPIPEDVPYEIKVSNGMKLNAKVKTNDVGKCLLKKGNEKNIKSRVEIIDEIKAPVENNQTLGRVVYSVDNSTILEYNIVADEAVHEMSFKKVFNVLFMKMLEC